MKFPPKICVLLGATASGKSALAQRFAGRCVLLSADSLAVFRELPIISAAPVGEEAANYCGVGIRGLCEDFCVADFLRLFDRARALAAAEGKPLLVVGGTAFYAAALFSGLAPAVPRFAGVFDAAAARETAALMRQIDPAAAGKISPNDALRLQRWREIYDHALTAPSEWLAANTAAPALAREEAAVYELVWPRGELLERIESRTRAMLAAGAVREVAAAMAAVAGGCAGGARGATELRAAVEANKALGCIGAKQIAAALLERLDAGGGGGAGGGGDAGGGGAAVSGGDAAHIYKGNARSNNEDKLMNGKNLKISSDKLTSPDAPRNGSRPEELAAAAPDSTAATDRTGPAETADNFATALTSPDAPQFGSRPQRLAGVPASVAPATAAALTTAAATDPVAAALLSAASALEADAAAMAALAAEIALRTRQYAKRQRTFCRKLAARPLDARDPAAAERQIAAALGLER